MNKAFETEASEEAFTSSSDVSDNVVNELILGMVTALPTPSMPRVEYFFQGEKHQVSAITTQQLSSDHVGRQVALMFVNGNAQQPIVLGLIRNALDDAIANFEPNDSIDLAPRAPSTDLASQECKVDGEKVVIEGKEEVVLKCGSASISLNKNGKIALRGKYLVSRSSGVNRILGGSVQVN